MRDLINDEIGHVYGAGGSGKPAAYENKPNNSNKKNVSYKEYSYNKGKNSNKKYNSYTHSYG